MRTSWKITVLVLVTIAVAGIIRYDTPGTQASFLRADSILARYWEQPLDPQGPPPDHWTDIEASLAPDACASCHPDQFAAWQTSFHSKAFSPGLVGQLLGYDSDNAAACMRCHAALAEQRHHFEWARVQGKGHVREAQGLAAWGNSCAGCHFRKRQCFGPPQRDTGVTGPGSSDAPHGGVYRSTFFESAEFCSGCHQFDSSLAVNGKPLENTYVEWQATSFAIAGVTCQGCHMPDRQHLWRGIHDPDMVKSGLLARFDASPDRARFELTSTGIGHAFPTYVTPKAVMRGIALDRTGLPEPGSDVSYVIQRVVEHVNGEWVERLDSRLLPGETATLDMDWPESGRVKMWLEVHPDDFYDHSVYDVLLQQLADGPAAELIAEADRLAEANRFYLFETEVTRP